MDLGPWEAAAGGVAACMGVIAGMYKTAVWLRSRAGRVRDLLRDRRLAADNPPEQLGTGARDATRQPLIITATPIPPTTFGTQNWGLGD
jgi:hypothetical protein